jgi:plasmid stabilization system protein ParE
VLNNPVAAERLHNKIVQKSILIGENPFLFRFCFEENLLAKGYRRAIVDNYLMLFTVDEEERLVVVKSVVYGRRDLGAI